MAATQNAGRGLNRGSGAGQSNGSWSRSAETRCIAREGAPELLYIKFTRKEQTVLPALVFKGKSRN